MDFPIDLRTKPEKSPIIIENASEYLNGSKSKEDGTMLIRGKLTCEIYLFLKANPDKAFTRGEVSKALGKKCNSASFTDLARKKLVFRLDKIPKVYGSSFLYSFSEKAIWKKAWELTPEPIKKCMQLILSDPGMIFSQNELLEMTRADRRMVKKWLHYFYSRKFKKLFGFALIQVTRKEGIRTFYYSHEMKEETFEALFDKYYKDKVLKQASLTKINGNNFEEFSTWVFLEYMKIKGLDLELIKVDREPCDYIAKLKVDISDTLGKDGEKSITLARFVISCKNWRLDRPVSSNYVLGMSGSLKEGLAFYYNRKKAEHKDSGDNTSLKRIFSPRSTVGVILCTRANYYAWTLARELGIMIFDSLKLLKMYEIVASKTGKTHPYHRNVKAKVEVYNKNQREMTKAMITGGLDA
jgi:hypothetical protein